MVALKKAVLCKCGSYCSFDFSSDMQIEDITVSARCPSCGANVHISVSAMLSSPSQIAPSQDPQSAAQEAVQEAHEPSMLDNLDSDTKENVEQALKDLFR